MSRIEKSQSKPLKRRRPSKKLVTTLTSLSSALPSIEDLTSITSGSSKNKLENGDVGKSLKSKPGAMKRKEWLERGERERFGRNLAVIMGSAPVDVGGEMDVEGDGQGEKEKEGSSKTAGRLKALRAWVGQNMEKNPAFEKKP